MIKLLDSKLNGKKEKSFELNLNNFNTTLTTFTVLLKFNYLQEYFSNLFNILDRQNKGKLITAELVLLLKRILSTIEKYSDNQKR